jgi:Mg-chelatase subunit ChlD
MVEKGSGSTATATRNQMASLTRAGGLTACYDAIWKALDTFETVRGSQNRTKVIICLTDGDDNMSSHKTGELVERFSKEASEVMLVIVAVGRLNTAEQLRSIAESSNGGTLVEAKNGLDDLDQAFEQVSELISGGEFRLESL